MDNWQTHEIPKQIIQSSRAHAIDDNQNNCEEKGFQGLGASKLYDIINSIKPEQQRVASGLDGIVVDGVRAWDSLSSNNKKLLF
jgi:hypothetical protein